MTMVMMTAVSRAGFARRHNGYWFDRFICDGSGLAFLEAAECECVCKLTRAFASCFVFAQLVFANFPGFLFCNGEPVDDTGRGELSTGEAHSSLWLASSESKSESHSHQQWGTLYNACAAPKPTLPPG